MQSVAQQHPGVPAGTLQRETATTVHAGVAPHAVLQGHAQQAGDYHAQQGTSSQAAYQQQYQQQVPHQPQQTYYQEHSQQQQQHSEVYVPTQAQHQQYFSQPQQQDQRQARAADPLQPQQALLYARSGPGLEGRTARHASMPEHLQPRPFQQQGEAPQRYPEQHSQPHVQPQPALQSSGSYPHSQAPHHQQHQQYPQAAPAASMAALDAGAPHSIGGAGAVHDGRATALGGPASAQAPAYAAPAPYQRGSSGGGGGVPGHAPAAAAAGPGALTSSQDAAWYRQNGGHAARYSPPRQQEPQQQPEQQQAASYIPLQPRQPQSLPAQGQPPQPAAHSIAGAPLPSRPLPPGGQPHVAAAAGEKPPSLPAHLKPVAVAPAPAVPVPAAAPAGFVQLVEQQGGIQVDKQGGLRLVLTTTGQPEPRLAPAAEPAPGPPLHPLHGHAAAPASAPVLQQRTPTGATPVNFEPLQSPLGLEELAQLQAHGGQQPSGSAAWSGPAADGAQRFVSTGRPPAGSDQAPRASGRRDVAELRAARPSAAEPSDHNVAVADARAAAAAAAAQPPPAAAGSRPRPSAARPEASERPPSGRSARVPIPVPQPRQPADRAGARAAAAGAPGRAQPAAPAPAAKAAEPAPAPAPSLAEAVQKAEKLQNTIKTMRADEDVFKSLLPKLLPELLETCGQRLLELSRAISHAKAGAKAAKEEAAAAAEAAATAAAEAAAAREAAAAESAPADLGPGPTAFLVELSIRKLFPLDTAEHALLRICAEALMVDARGGQIVAVNGEEVLLQDYQEVGAHLCNISIVADAVTAAREAGLKSSLQVLLRQHDLFEVQDHYHKQDPTNKQWLVRLRAELLPGFSALHRTFRAVIDTLLPSLPPAHGSGPAPGPAAGGGEAERALVRPAGSETESADEHEALRCIALHLLGARDPRRGCFIDLLGAAAAAALPPRLERKYARSSDLGELRALLHRHPLFTLRERFPTRKTGQNVPEETLYLNTPLMLEYYYRARRQGQGSRKRKAGDGAEADGEAVLELSSWWRDKLARSIKVQRQG